MISLLQRPDTSSGHVYRYGSLVYSRLPAIGSTNTRGSRHERDWYVAIHRETFTTRAAYPSWGSVGDFLTHARGARGHRLADSWRRSGGRAQSAGVGQATGTARTQSATVCTVPRLALWSRTPPLWLIPVDRCSHHR